MIINDEETAINLPRFSEVVLSDELIALQNDIATLEDLCEAKDNNEHSFLRRLLIDNDSATETGTYQALVARLATLQRNDSLTAEQLTECSLKLANIKESIYKRLNTHQMSMVVLYSTLGIVCFFLAELGKATESIPGFTRGCDKLMGQENQIACVTDRYAKLRTGQEIGYSSIGISGGAVIKALEYGVANVFMKHVYLPNAESFATQKGRLFQTAFRLSPLRNLAVLAVAINFLLDVLNQQAHFNQARKTCETDFMSIPTLNQCMDKTLKNNFDFTSNFITALAFTYALIPFAQYLYSTIASCSSRLFHRRANEHHSLLLPAEQISMRPILPVL